MFYKVKIPKIELKKKTTEMAFAPLPLISKTCPDLFKVKLKENM